MKINAEGKTEFERFNNVVKKILSVSKEELDRRLAADSRGHYKSEKKKSKKRIKDGKHERV
ncbi:MAG TPA: hypothetical protein VGK48_03805 [Terriglobia bacterium]|jgi:hypothetical protein